jgi:hypothetical protein
MTVQDDYLTKRNKDTRNIEFMLGSLKQALEKSFDQSMQSHIEGVVFQMSGMTDILESKFNELGSRFDTLENKIDQHQSALDSL